MKKLKLFTIHTLSYLFIMSILLTISLTKSVNSIENEYSSYLKNNYNLKGSTQYKNEFLIAYGESKTKDITLATVKNGKETFLKKVSEYDIVEILSSGENKVGIAYNKEKGGIVDYEEFDFNTSSFRKITKEEFWNTVIKEDDENNQEIIKDKGEITKYLNKINKKYNLNLNIEGKEYSESSGLFEDIKGNQTFVSVWNYYENPNIKFIDYYEYNIDNSKTSMYTGVMYKDYLYITEFDGENPLKYNISNKDSIYIWEEIDKNNYNLIKIRDGKEISKGKININDNTYPYLKEFDNKIYIIGNNKLYIYELLNNNYKLFNTINYLSLNYTTTKALILEKENNNIYLSEVVNGKQSKIIELTKEINSISNGNLNYYNINDLNGNMNITAENGFILVQKMSKILQDEVAEIETEEENNLSSNEDIIIEENNEIEDENFIVENDDIDKEIHYSKDNELEVDEVDNIDEDIDKVDEYSEDELPEKDSAGVLITKVVLGAAITALVVTLISKKIKKNKKING